MRASILLASLMLSLAGCDAREVTGAVAQASRISGDPGEVPILGEGYDPIAARLTGLRCFRGGRIVDEEARTAKITVARDLSYEELNRALSAQISISVPI